MMLTTNENVPWEELTAVVTGGSRGIGAAAAEAMAAKGVAVVIGYLDRSAAADEVAGRIREVGGRAIAVQADLASAGGATALADAALAEYGRVDVIVNNASPPIVRKPVLELERADADAYWAVYVQATLELVQRCVPGMKEREFGRIVNILSSYHHGTPPSDLAAYVAAKGALWGLTRAMSVELAPFGSTVNALSPSPVMTEQWDSVPEARRRALALKAPLRRLATPEDVARGVLYLVGESGSFLTGIDVPITGGEVM